MKNSIMVGTIKIACMLHSTWNKLIATVSYQFAKQYLIISKTLNEKYLRNIIIYYLLSFLHF